MRKLFSFLLGFICVINASVASTSDDIAIYIEPDVIEHAIREFFSDASDGRWRSNIGRVPNNFEQIVLDAHDNLNYCILNTPDNLLASGCIVNFCRDVMGSVMLQDSGIVDTKHAAAYCKAFAARLIELEICIQEEYPEIPTEPTVKPEQKPEQKPDPVSEPEQKSEPKPEQKSEPEKKNKPICVERKTNKEFCKYEWVFSLDKYHEYKNKKDGYYSGAFSEKKYGKYSVIHDYAVKKSNSEKTNRTNIVYVDKNGTGFVRSGGSLAWRLFNPGNLRRSGSACAMFCLTQKDCFAAFDSYERGREALENLLRENKKRYYNNNIYGAISTYAPSEDNNNPRVYADRVKKAIRNNVKTPGYWDKIVKGGKRIDTITVGELLQDDTMKKYLLDGIQDVEGYCRKGSFWPGMFCFENNEFPTVAEAEATRSSAHTGIDMICPVPDKKACEEHKLPE